MYTLLKSIPLAKLETYLQHGWAKQEENFFAKPVEGMALVSTDYADGSAYPTTGVIRQKPMYLIQRGIIRRPLNANQGLHLSGAVQFDYMGAAEFEFGALPRSFRAIRYQMFDFKIHKLEEVARHVDGQTYALRLFTAFEGADLAAYVEQLKVLQTGALEHVLHEHSGFSVGKISDFYHTDFWWDIENHCMWSYDRQFMKRLPEHLEASFKRLEEPR